MGEQEKGGGQKPHQVRLAKDETTVEADEPVIGFAQTPDESIAQPPSALRWRRLRFLHDQPLLRSSKRSANWSRAVRAWRSRRPMPPGAATMRCSATARTSA